MPEAPDPRDLELLGLSSTSTLADLHRAYQRARSLWSDDSLATYGLMDEAEREATLSRLTAAYERLLRRLDPEAVARGSRSEGISPEARSLPPVPAPRSAEPAAAPAAGDRNPDPGAVLCARRTAAGLSLEAVARETRIRGTLLEALEQGNRRLLPAPVYVRGFVIAHARVVGIEEPEELARRYLEWLETRES